MINLTSIIFHNETVSYPADLTIKHILVYVNTLFPFFDDNISILLLFQILHTVLTDSV